MNGRERIGAVLRGERVDRPPVMLHHFMHAAREAGLTMRRFRTEPHEMARAFIESVERYELDGVMIDVDTATLAGALGVPVEYPEDEPAVARGSRIQSLAEVERLERPEIGRFVGVQVWLEAVRLIVNYFRGSVWVRGNCDQCPFALAALVRGMEGWLTDLLDEEKAEGAERLLKYCAEAGLQFLELMSGTGADMVSNGDSAAGPSVVSPRIYRRWALPWERRFAERAHQLGLPYALHICGNTRLILEDLAECGAEAVELDYKTDAGAARAALRGRVTFIGNLDPSGVVALGTEEAVYAESRRVIGLWAEEGSRFILNAGCAVPATAPAANLRAMVRAAQSW